MTPTRAPETDDSPAGNRRLARRKPTTRPPETDDSRGYGALVTTDLAAAVDRVLPGVRGDLERLVRIPSIWADPGHAEDTRHSAAVVAELARDAGAANVR